MSDLLSMSLDQIIDQKKQARKDAKQGGRGSPTRKTPDNNTFKSGGVRRSNQARNTPYMRNGSSKQTNGTATATSAPLVPIDQNKILISNLAQSVSQKDLTDLFSRIGPIRSASLNYDEHGKSKGNGTVIFQKSTDAAKAIKEYHDRLFDNKPMKLELVLNASKTTILDSGRVALQTTESRLGPLPKQQQGMGGGPIRKVTAGSIKKGAAPNQTNKSVRGRRRRGMKRSDQPAKSADQLDAEMDAYMKDQEMNDA